MKEKIKEIFEIQWLPAIVTITTLAILMLTCFSYTLNRIDQQKCRLDEQCKRIDKLCDMFVNLLTARTIGEK